MKKARLFTAALLAGSAMLASSPASAQRIDRIVAFGDSYADDGNLFQLLGINPATTQVYTTGRFSGGTNYIDSLGQILNAPIDNFAIGGANTDNTNVNGVPLGFQTEYGSFLSGGGPAAFPRVSGTFGANDLLAISIGGNDARFYQQTGGTLAGASAAANVSAANATAGLNLLVAAGAQNISFLAGDTGRLPEIAANPTGAQVRSDFDGSPRQHLHPADIRLVLRVADAHDVDALLQLLRRTPGRVRRQRRHEGVLGREHFDRRIGHGAT